MKYRKKFIICSLLAGLTVSINSCNKKGPTVKLLSAQSLSIPSASAIECYKDRLFVFGDDATYLLILSPTYQILDTIHYLPKTVGRLSKESKPDIESAIIMKENGKPVLMGIGSMSNKLRWNVMQFLLDSLTFTTYQLFKSNTRFATINEINIEGSCIVGNTIVFSNRANMTNKINHLLFLKENDSVDVREILFPEKETIPGISGLTYVKEKDLLVFTASEEATPNALEDGTIGDSYIGWITTFSNKMNAKSFSHDGLLKLADFDAIFSKQKIESLCVERFQGDHLILHLVADNDDGKSNIYKIELKL
jgi:hypothetical protein